MSFNRTDIVQRDTLDVNNIDNGIKNKWRWNWLESKADDGVWLGEFIRKIRQCGKAVCIVCNIELNYASRGKIMLLKHANSGKHRDIVKIRQTNYRLPGVGSAGLSKPYGIFMSASTTPDVQPPQPEPKLLIPLKDRQTNQEGMMLAFLAEHSLSFSIAPHLVELAKELSRDQKALSSLSMSRTAASYKTRLGLAKTFDDELATTLRDSHFSLNVDEATSDTRKKILTTLVSFYSSELKKVVVRHLSSCEMIVVNSEAIFLALVTLFSDRNIPWKNLVSVLFDSCNVMRGCRSGVETRIREGPARHLLDINGDSLHHVHNCAKQFTKQFDMFVEKMFVDIFNDIKWSPDLRDFLKEICELIGITFTMPERYVPTRWLSVYDVAHDTLQKIDSLVLFYYSFIAAKDKAIYTGYCVEIYHRRGIREQAKQRIQAIQAVLKKKNLTDDGASRKQRIIQRLFIQRKRTRLYLNFYCSVLPLLKKYLLLFQSSEPKIHKMNDEQVSLLKDFLVCFMKPEVILASSARQLTKLKLDDHLLSNKDMFLGCRVNRIVQDSRKDCSSILDFVKRARSAYLVCGQYLIAKMPVNNKFLRSVSAIDPLAHGHEASLKCLKELPSIVTNILTDDELDPYCLEVHRFQKDPNLPSANDAEGTPVRIDTWWTHVSNTSQYPMLCKMVFACISCFHCPVVESSFSLMGNILDSSSYRTNAETFSAIQTVKYTLSASEKSAIDYLKKTDFLHDPVDSKLVMNMCKSASLYKEEQVLCRQQKEQRLKDLEVKQTEKVSKRKAREITIISAKKARVAHVAAVSAKRLDKQTMKERLQKLCEKRKSRN